MSLALFSLVVFQMVVVPCFLGLLLKNGWVILLKLEKLCHLSVISVKFAHSMCALKLHLYQQVFLPPDCRDRNRFKLEN